MSKGGVITVSKSGELASDIFLIDTAALSVVSSGQLNNKNTFVGDAPGSNAVANITGTGLWINSVAMNVGVSGNGTLNILTGGTLQSDGGVIGSFGSVGTVTLDGAGSNWINKDDLTVGNGGSGTMLITSGADVTNKAATVGSSGTGSVTVNGAGSTWTSTADLTLGLAGSGTLTVQNGGLVSAPNIVKGVAPGTINLDGGSLSVGTITTSNFNIANGSGSTGTYTENGGVVNAQTTRVGNAGNGTLLITGGGRIEDFDGIIAAGAASTSSATVSGVGSGWFSVDKLSVGGFGDGTLLIEAGGSVLNDAAIIGEFAGSNSSATVSGAGSTWSNDDMTVAFSGTGTLQVDSGASVTTRLGYIGFGLGSFGVATITGAGSSWAPDTIWVGDRGQGTLDITAGGTVSSDNGYVGDFSGGLGVVNVSGPGSNWTNTGVLTLGGQGTAVLNLLNQGQVSTASIANGAGSGTINIDGGSLTAGTIAVDFFTVGRAPGSNGSHTQNGGLVTAPSTTVGDLGNGVLTIENAGTFNTNIGNIGRQANASGTVNVTGLNSTWQVVSLSLGMGFGSQGTLNLYDQGKVVVNTIVDGVGTGTINIDGGTLNSLGNIDVDNFNVGQQFGSTGVYTEAGGGGQLLPTNLVVGGLGNGTLMVTTGGIASTSSTVIGKEGPGIGQLFVEGVGSDWTTSGTVVVGQSGIGTLRVLDAAKSAGATIVIGDNPSGNGTVEVTDPNTRLTSTGNLAVGNSGSGVMNILAGADVFSGSASIAGLGGSSGQVLVDGLGSSWAITNSLSIGNGGAGTLTVTDQAQVSAMNVLEGAGSSTINIDGGTLSALSIQADVFNIASTAGSKGSFSRNSGFVVTDIFNVGKAGEGTLILENDAQLLSNSGFIGSDKSSDGTAIVDAPLGKWDVAGSLVVGLSGQGSMQVINGSTVESLNGWIGQNSGSQGDVTVSGVNSNWTVSNKLAIGQALGGQGTLTVENQGMVSADLITKGLGNSTINLNQGLVQANSIDVGSFNIAQAPGSVGSQTVSAGQTFAASSLAVGGGGDGLFTVIGGGTVTTGTTLIARDVGSTGIAEVNGAGTSWVSSSGITVGQSGIGSLVILSEGQVSDTSTTIGSLPGSFGTVSVFGNNSQLTNTGPLIVGQSGQGTLNIGSMAQVTAASVKSGTGIGTININGGTLSSPSVEVDNFNIGNSGSFARNVGQQLITTNLKVGNTSTGSLNVTGGGTVTSTTASIAHNLGTSGTATINGVGSAWNIDTSLDIGSAGTGSLIVKNDGAVTVGTTLTVGASGSVNLTGGILDAQTIDHTLGGNFGFFSGGTLVVDTFDGNLAQLGGTASPGNAAANAPGNSVGTMFVTGMYGFFGELQIEIGGLNPGTEHDRVQVNGLLDFFGGSVLSVSLINGFTPSVADSFDILDFSSTQASLSSISLPAIGPNLTWDTSSIYADGTISVLPTLPGDTDGDGDIDDSDLGTSFSNYTGPLVPGVGGKTAAQGDTDGDGDVDDSDLGTSFSGYTGPIAVSIPEPSALVLLTFGGLLVNRRRARH